jgi:integrase
VRSLRARRLAESTIRTKQRLIRRFRAWLYVEGRASSLAAIDEQTAREYRRWLASHLSPTSWNPILAAPSQFFRWAVRHQLVLLDPFECVRPTPMQRTLPPYLTQAEVRSILAVCDPETQLRDGGDRARRLSREGPHARLLTRRASDAGTERRERHPVLDPSAIRPFYGSSPQSFYVFVRLRGGSASGHGHSMPM